MGLVARASAWACLSSASAMSAARQVAINRSAPSATLSKKFPVYQTYKSSRSWCLGACLCCSRAMASAVPPPVGLSSPADMVAYPPAESLVSVRGAASSALRCGGMLEAMPGCRLLWLRSWLPHFTRNSLAFGAARFSYSVLTTMFYFYITTIFTNIYQITDTHFYVSHVVYAIWNAINDPAFAWLLDNTTATGAARRLPAIKYGGPLWSLAFLVPWWPWSSVPGSWLVGAHFCFSMCLFDSFVSYVGMVQSALLADMTTDNSLRNNYNNVASLLGVVGRTASAVSYHLYDASDLGRFRLFCVVSACVSCVGFLWAGTNLDVGRLDSLSKQESAEMVPVRISSPDSASVGSQDRARKGRQRNRRSSLPEMESAAGVDHEQGEEEEEALLPKDIHGHGKAARAPVSGGEARGPGRVKEVAKESGRNCRPGERRKLSFCGFMRQLASHRNFWLYVVMNFLENFNGLFDDSFFVFLDTTLFREALPMSAHAALAGSCLYFSKIMIQVLTPVANRFGTYHLILGATAFKLLAGMMIFAGGMRAWPLWAALYVGNRLAATTWGFYNLCMADVIDEDILRNRRRKSMSVSVHGVQSLFVKPAQSLAPIMGMALLPKGALSAHQDDPSDEKMATIRQAAFTLLWAVPVGCGAIQMLIWRAYGLHGTALDEMKLRLKEWESSVHDDEEYVSELDS